MACGREGRQWDCVVVVHVVVEEFEPVIRIVSARRAAWYEREEYENG